MKVLRLAVIAGTSEATDLIAALPEQDSVTAFAATEYGKTILEGQHCMVRVGRLDADGFRFALRGMDAVIDASHPFAQVVTETVRQGCAEMELPYFRLGRQKMTYDYSRVIRVESKEQAAACLAAIPGNILLTTGVNTLSFYEKAIPDFSTRGWARILDTPDSRRAAADSKAHLIFAIPPFSKEDTLELLEKYHIAVLVSKDSGRRGGVAEKMDAAKQMDIPVVLLGAPEEEVHTISQVLESLDRYRKGETDGGTVS